jgi:hypothetical protein
MDAMKSYGARIALYAALVAVCVFFGIDMATSGMERVSGPVTPAPVQASNVPSPPPVLAVKETKPKEPAAVVKPATPPPMHTFAGAAESSLINRTFLQIGDGLRYFARGTIRFIVSVFSAIIH